MIGRHGYAHTHTHTDRRPIMYAYIAGKYTHDGHTCLSHTQQRCMCVCVYTTANLSGCTIRKRHAYRYGTQRVVHPRKRPHRGAQKRSKRQSYVCVDTAAFTVARHVCAQRVVYFLVCISRRHTHTHTHTAYTPNAVGHTCTSSHAYLHAGSTLVHTIRQCPVR